MYCDSHNLNGSFIKQNLPHRVSNVVSNCDDGSNGRVCINLQYMFKTLHLANKIYESLSIVDVVSLYRIKCSGV